MNGYFFFFFQAEDGIRDKLVTGVQTCALPILRVLSTMNPQSALPAQQLGGLGAVSFETIQLDGGALLFALFAAIATGLLFGLVPALQATRPSLTAALKEGTAEAPTRAAFFRRLTTRN